MNTKIDKFIWSIDREKDTAIDALMAIRGYSEKVNQELKRRIIYIEKRIAFLDDRKMERKIELISGTKPFIDNIDASPVIVELISDPLHSLPDVSMFDATN